MENLRVSEWTFVTSASVGIGLGFAAMSGGTIALKNPKDRLHQFHYRGLGIGGSAGLSLTKINVPENIVQSYIPSGSGSLPSFPGNGIVCMTAAFRGEELTEADICGVAAYIELGISMIAGYGLTIMFLGLSPLLTLANIPAPQFHFLEVAISQAPAVLIMWGPNMGPSVSLGGNGLLGILR